MKIKKTENVEMSNKGCPYCIEWNDGSKTFYKSKEDAEYEMINDFLKHKSNTIINGNCVEKLRELPDNSVDSIVTDPPYFLIDNNGKGFMGKEWESLNINKSLPLLWKSKEFVNVVEWFLKQITIELNMEEENFVQENVNMKEEQKTQQSQNVQFVEKKLKDTNHKLNQSINSVQGIALTKEEVVGMLIELLPKNTKLLEKIKKKENVFFVIPFMLFPKKLKNIVQENVMNMIKEKELEVRTIPVTLMEEVKIKDVIEGMIGIEYENQFIKEIIGSVEFVEKNVQKKKYNVITLSHIERQKIIQWITLLLYVSNATIKSKESLNLSLMQMFHNEWAKECLRVLKPGGFLLSFGGTRTYHRMACAIEDAGFEIRDQMQWLYGCISEDTEILTTEGFKSYKEIKTSDKVYSFNMLKGCIEKTKIEEIFIYPYENRSMVNLKNDNTNQLLTLNHKVIMKEEFREQKDGSRKWHSPENWSWNYANNIKNYGKYNLPLGSVYDGFLTEGVDYAELLGWILSEGHFQKDTNAINIYQSSVNKEKVDMIRDLLNRMNIKHSEYKRKRKYVYKHKGEQEYIEHQFYFSGKIVDSIKDIIPDKKPTKILWDLKYEEKLALFNSLMLGDGCKKGNKNGEYTAFYQKDKEFLEWFQVLCHLIGKQARINLNKWVVEVHHNPNTQLQARHLKDRIVNYVGKVWSIKTTNMSYIARRNGNIFITGNSGFPKSFNIAKGVEGTILNGNSNTTEFKKLKGEKERVVNGYTKLEFEHGVKPANYNDENGGGYIANPEFETEEAKRWNGWGSALKPANEPIVMARKPLSEKNLALNVLKWGTGGINIDGCRIEFEDTPNPATNPKYRLEQGYKTPARGQESQGAINFSSSKNQTNVQGRFPANIILDEEAGKMLDEQSGITSQGHWAKTKVTGFGEFGNGKSEYKGVGEKDKIKGGASRFFMNISTESIINRKELDKLCYENLSVEDVEKSLLTMNLIGQDRINSVQRNALPNIISQNPNLDVLFVEKNVDYIEINSVQKLVQILTDGIMETMEKNQLFLKTYDLMPVQLQSIIILTQNLAYSVGKKEKSDIMRIIQNLKILFGCVEVATTNITDETFRFKYVAKASKSERNAGLDDFDEKPIEIQQPHNSKNLDERYEMKSKNHHPTVKPLKLMQYLVRLVTPKNGIVLDPFMGSGTTAVACIKENLNFLGIEREKDYVDIANARINGVKDDGMDN